MIMYLVIILFVSLAFYLYSQHDRRKFKLLDMIPGPPGLPIIRNLLLGIHPVEKMWTIVYDYTKAHYPTTVACLASYAVVTTCDADDVEILLTSQKHIKKGYAYNKLQPWLGTGLLTSHGEKWRQRRKILTPAFHFNILKKYLEITNENAQRFIENLKSEGEESIQYLEPLCSKYTLNIICESAMGVALNKMDSSKADEYKNAIYKMGNIAVYRNVNTQQVLSDRREYHKNTEYKYLKFLDDDPNASEADNVYGGRKKRLSMLDLLLSAERDNLINEEGIKEEVDTFMFEGHDTTGMAMVYTLMLLAENEEIQKKARSEVTTVLDKSDGKIGMPELQELNYLERCIKESLRLYPPVSIISRYLTEDLQLTKYLIPSETEVFHQLYHIHRDPKYWTQPEEFNPDRFLPENSKGRHPFSYIPFSAGPRNCIGQKFALMELKSLVAQILYNFKLEAIDRTSDMQLLLDIVIRPTKPVRTKFIKIQK